MTRRSILATLLAAVFFPKRLFGREPRFDSVTPTKRLADAAVKAPLKTGELNYDNSGNCDFSLRTCLPKELIDKIDLISSKVLRKNVNGILCNEWEVSVTLFLSYDNEVNRHLMFTIPKYVPLPPQYLRLMTGWVMPYFPGSAVKMKWTDCQHAFPA